MYKLLHSRISSLYHTQVPATGIGLFRIFFGLVTLQEVCFLLYFNHLIFDPIPYLDIEFPMIPFFLCLWAIIACCVTLGYHSQKAIITNYIFWMVFVSFTPMQRDFDGGFDLFMIGANLFMIFMPIDKAFSIDGLRRKLQTPFKHYSLYPKQNISILAYYIPVIICLGFLYFDSAIHKMFAPHWRNGLGAWLPSSIPFYISSIDMSWLLNNEILQKCLGYLILVFQFSFVFLFYFRSLRPLFFIIGAGLHLGITLTFNIYPFGIGMLIFYTLVAPFSWYRKIGTLLSAKSPALTVFYDEQCPLCCQTVLTLNHFDIFNCIDFKGAQSHASKYPQLSNIKETTLLTDLFALDKNNKLYAGVATYSQILIKMRYTAIAGYLLKAPGIYQLACKIYRDIADNRTRLTCDGNCAITDQGTITPSLYDRVFTPGTNRLEKYNIHIISKILLLLFLLQLNSSVRYGLFYRLKPDITPSAITSLISSISNSIVNYSSVFLGITPHALYLHDHFEGYNHLIAITYTDLQGNEKWLPFVNSEGRLQAPNWGRVHSMWANIAVTPNIDNHRLSKFIMKTTAFWGINSGLDLNATTFHIKLKKISAPNYWVPNLLKSNLSAPWMTIGQATWMGKDISISIPKDINAL
jgi:predicted DCC family thiol-disulfide oxidoreductase YuxK